MTNRSRLLIKAMGAFGLSLAPVLFLLGVFASANSPGMAASLFLLSLGLCFLSGITLAVTSSDSKARIAQASGVSALGFILVGLTFSWFDGREGYAGLFYLIFFLVLLFGLGREASQDEASTAPIFLKWGLGLTLCSIPLMVAGFVAVVTSFLGMVCFYCGIVKWAFELFALARKASDVDRDSLAL